MKATRNYLSEPRRARPDTIAPRNRLADGDDECSASERATVVCDFEECPSVGRQELLAPTKDLV
jgi:hypothetical protein